MKRTLILLLILSFILPLVGCGKEADKKGCQHHWERTENYNEYTAMDKCSLCGMTRMYTDSENIPHSGTEAGFAMLRYRWDGYGVATKEIFTCDLGYAIIDCLSKLQETGDTSPKLSDEAFDAQTLQLPTESGTVWIECGSVGLFRLNPEMTEICKVETHLGEGKVLKMTDTLKELLRQAWYYHPYDCWSGTYENGEISPLQQVYKVDSAVYSVMIDSIYIENIYHPNNKMTLRLRGAENKNATVYLQCQQSDDNLSAGDSKDIVLTENEDTVVELTFGGFTKIWYYLTIYVDNTRISLTIYPQDKQ